MMWKQPCIEEVAYVGMLPLLHIDCRESLGQPLLTSHTAELPVPCLADCHSAFLLAYCLTLPSGFFQPPPFPPLSL